MKIPKPLAKIGDIVVYKLPRKKNNESIKQFIVVESCFTEDKGWLYILKQSSHTHYITCASNKNIIANLTTGEWFNE